MIKKLHEIKEYEFFKIDDEEYQLICHDDSGSMSAGPRCRRTRDNEIVYFSYAVCEYADKARFISQEVIVED